MWNWFKNNKTKIAGLVVVIVGALQTTGNVEVLQRIMGPDGYPIFNMLMGLIVTALGFWNSAEIKRQGGNGFALLAFLSYLTVVWIAGSFIMRALRVWL